MESSEKSLWAKSLLLRVFVYAALASAVISGFAAWRWRIDPPLGVRLDGYLESVVHTACGIFWTTFLVLGSVLWLRKLVKEWRSSPPER